jgi:hypothetical protein
MQGFDEEKSAGSGRSGYEPGVGGRVRGKVELREELLTVAASLKPLADDNVVPLSAQQLKVFSQEMSRRLDDEIAHSGSERLQTWRDKWFARNPQAGHWMVLVLVAGVLVLLAAAIVYVSLRGVSGSVAMPAVGDAGRAGVTVECVALDSGRAMIEFVAEA